MGPARLQFRPPDHRRKHHRRSAVRLLLIVAAASLVLAGCGGSGDGEGIAAFTPEELTALPEQDWITNGGTWRGGRSRCRRCRRFGSI
jgi:hypothetical protein